MEIAAKIEKMVHGGFGLSRTEKGIVFVSGGLPGETVRATMDNSVGGQAHASVLEILEPSPFRREPKCPHWKACGGCDWLHVLYKEQVSMKLGIFQECLQRIGKISILPSIDVFESKEFGYRRRAQFKLDRAKNTAGFFKMRSSEIVPVLKCQILNAQLNELLAVLPRHASALLKHVVQVKAIAEETSENAEDSPRKAVPRDIATSPEILGVTKGSIQISVDSKRFVVDGNSFFQSNQFLAGAMGSWAEDKVGGETFWDLYSGTGFFSVFLGKKFKTGFAVDNEPSHAIAARKNLDMNGVVGIATETRTAAQFLAHAVKSGVRSDCVVIDPPREGLQKNVRDLLVSIAPPSILYVSCDPATQARDAAFLMRAGGYKIDKAAFFDCYPQTHHLETILLFRR